MGGRLENTVGESLECVLLDMQFLKKTELGSGAQCGLGMACALATLRSVATVQVDFVQMQNRHVPSRDPN